MRRRPARCRRRPPGTRRIMHEGPGRRGTETTSRRLPVATCRRAEPCVEVAPALSPGMSQGSRVAGGASMRRRPVRCRRRPPGTRRIVHEGPGRRGAETTSRRLPVATCRRSEPCVEVAPALSPGVSQGSRVAGGASMRRRPARCRRRPPGTRCIVHEGPGRRGAETTSRPLPVATCRRAEPCVEVAPALSPGVSQGSRVAGGASMRRRPARCRRRPPGTRRIVHEGPGRRGAETTSRPLPVATCRRAEPCVEVAPALSPGVSQGSRVAGGASMRRRPVRCRRRPPGTRRIVHEGPGRRGAEATSSIVVAARRGAKRAVEAGQAP